MPKPYKRKKEPYNNKRMQEAVSAVLKGTYSIRKAADIINVNKSTLQDTMKKKFKNPGKPGRRTTIPPEIEEKIANALKEASRQGMGISRRQLLRRVGTLCKKNEARGRAVQSKDPRERLVCRFSKVTPYALNSQTRNAEHNKAE